MFMLQSRPLTRSFPIFLAVVAFGCSAGEQAPNSASPDSAPTENATDFSIDANDGSTQTPTPTAYTGGRDVALLWKTIQWSRKTARYDVYRDGTLIGTASPSVYVAGNSAATYHDNSVVDGQRYSYQVQAVADDGARAARSKSVSITHSTTGTPVPPISIETNGNDFTRPYLERGKAYLETWYPKIANLLTHDAYSAPNHLILRAVRDTADEPCLGAAGWTDGTPEVIHICANDGIGESDDVGLFVHEATHLIQAYNGPQLTGAGESIATWAGNLSIGRDNVRPGAFFSYFDDYEYGAYFYDWIARDKPNFIHDLNVVCHNGSFSAGWMEQYTGQSIGKLFGKMMGTQFTSSGTLKTSSADRFVKPLDSTPGSRLVLQGSPDDVANFFQGPMKALPGPGPLRWGKSVCIDEDAQHNVVVQSCNGTSSAQWRYLDAAHSFRNEATGRCIQPQDGSIEVGTPLVTEPCTGSAAQAWEPLPL